MSSIEIRKELHQYIDNSTDEIIAAVYALLKTYNTTHSEETDINWQIYAKVFLLQAALFK